MKIKLKDNDNVLILHHWDCDGICSSVLLSRYLREINSRINTNFFLPKLGNYYLDEKDYEAINKKNPSIFFIADLSLPRRDVLNLKENIKSIYFFDHHKQEKIKEVNHINPFTEESLSSLDFPSTGWVINSFFEKPQEILSILGAIGDQEEKVKENENIKNVIKEINSDFNELQEIVKNIDSCYILNDLKGIKEVRDFLINNTSKVFELARNKKLLRNREKIAKIISDSLSDNQVVLENNRIIIKEIKTDYHIISDIARLLSKKYKSYIIIVINYTSNSICNVYFRTKRDDIDLYKVIDLAIENGYIAGGKREVAGIIIPKMKTEAFIDNAIKLIV